MGAKKSFSENTESPGESGEIERLLNLGTDSYRKGDMDTAKALFDHVLSLRPDHPDALHYMGLLAYWHGQKDIAISLLTHVLLNAPRKYDVHYNLGQIYDSMDNGSQAISCYETAVTLKSDCIDIITRLGNAYTRAGQYQEALHLYTDALQKHPDNAVLLTRTGMLLYELQMPHSALPFFKSSLAIDDTNMVTRLYMSECLKSTGDLTSAKALAQSVLSLDPENIHAFCSLSETEKFPPQHPAFSFLETQAHNSELSDKIRSGILFSLGKMYADINDFDRSFEQYQEANQLRTSYSGRFDRAVFTRRLEAGKAIFTKEYFSHRENFGIQSAVPVFIVGMPRSGTSLIEQILATHSQVFGAGELKQISILAATLCDVEKQFDSAKDITEASVRKAAHDYLSYIRTLSPNANRIVDKMPGNLFNLWAIALMFPHSKVIYCKRNPLDNCIACFVKNFTERHIYANNLRDLGYYYSHSVSMMEHWKKNLPLAILDMEYESVVDDLEGSVRKLLDFCGLEWEESCLEFHKTERKVLTASRIQVRKKLYTSSVGRHRQYEKYLAPLISALREAGLEDWESRSSRHTEDK